MKRTTLDQTWRPLYAIASAAALLYVIMAVIPLTLVFSAPPVPSSGAGVLEYIASYKTVYLVQLIGFAGLSVPALVVFLALGIALKDQNKSLAAIGALIGIASEILALAPPASPQSLHVGLVYLSNQYAAAASDAQRLALSSAAEAFIAGANGVSVVGSLTALAILILSLAMLKGLFSRITASLGVATGAVGVCFEVLRPMLGSAYIIYGTLLFLWFIAVGIRFYGLARRAI
jgi:hypothetical protein